MSIAIEKQPKLSAYFRHLSTADSRHVDQETRFETLKHDLISIVSSIVLFATIVWLLLR